MQMVDVQRARLQAASIAAEVLAGRVSAVIGAVDVTRLRPSLDVPDDDPEFETFMLIDSECEGLPIGPVRQYWSAEALVRKAPDVAHAEQSAMATGREAFQRIVERFGAANRAMRNTDLESSWERTRGHLAAGAAALDRATADRHAWQLFEEFLAHNELELALDELEAAAGAAAQARAFWGHLADAAQEMCLDRRAVELRSRVAGAK
jgi:hypothetical protein